MPDHTSVWVHGEKVSARGEVLWAVWGEICFQLEKKHFCNCPRGAFEIPSLCGVGAAGTDQEMLQQQHQHFIHPLRCKRPFCWDPKLQAATLIRFLTAPHRCCVLPECLL